jgi:hypothetical protein
MFAVGSISRGLARRNRTHVVRRAAGSLLERRVPPVVVSFVRFVGSRTKKEGRMKWIALGVALAVQLAGVAAAQACTGQTGNVIFQDKFADDTGGWDFDPPTSQVTPPAFVFNLGKTYTITSAENLTFNATLGDYCMDFVLPKSPAADNTAAVGMIIWATDYNNYMLVVAFSNGNVGMYKKSAGNFTTLFTVLNSPAFNAAQDAVNSLRVVATPDQKLTVTLNGQAVKAIRAQVPTGPQLFGLFGQLDKALPADIAIKVTNFSVTSGG